MFFSDKQKKTFPSTQRESNRAKINGFSLYQTIIDITVVNRKLEDHIADWAVNGTLSAKTEIFFVNFSEF
jgi:hypothetical protein